MNNPKPAPEGAMWMQIPQAIRLASQHHDAGRLAQAEDICRQILQARPDNPEALHMLGVVAQAAGNLPRSIELINRAIAGDGRRALYHANLGEIYRRLGRIDDAIASARRALVLESRNPQVLNNLAIALYERREYPEAESLLRKALALHPGYVEAHSNLGNAIRAQHRPEEAISWYRRSVNLKPNFADGLANLATTLKDIGEYHESLTYFDQAIEVEPNHANARSGRALVLLMLGDYAKGLRDYEWRWQSSEMRSRNFFQPPWAGDPLAGRRLLVHGEQGFGDSLNFCRYLPDLRKQDGQIIFEVQTPLVQLMAANYPWLRVVPQGTLPPFDQHCALVTLALLAGTTPDTIPAEIPYLKADPAATARWAARMSGKDLRVGFVWTGNPLHRNDFNRSATIEQLAPLFDVPGVAFFSLLPGPRAAELKRLSNFGAGTDLSAELVDFSETAAAVANLDLVISVDTAIVHVAGALGKPVWVMLPKVPDWRWMLEREDSPWYPTMRLFRHRQTRDWAEVVARVAAELRAVAAGDRARLTPRREAQ